MKKKHTPVHLPVIAVAFLLLAAPVFVAYPDCNPDGVCSCGIYNCGLGCGNDPLCAACNDIGCCACSQCSGCAECNPYGICSCGIYGCNGECGNNPSCGECNDIGCCTCSPCGDCAICNPDGVCSVCSTYNCTVCSPDPDPDETHVQEHDTREPIDTRTGNNYFTERRLVVKRCQWKRCQ